MDRNLCTIHTLTRERKAVKNEVSTFPLVSFCVVFAEK